MKYTIDDINTSSDNKFVIIKQEEKESSPLLPEEAVELINQRIDSVEAKNTIQDADIDANSGNISTLQEDVGILRGNIETAQEDIDSLAIKTIDDFKSAILDYVYPVGSVAIFYNTVSPSNTLGGTWEKISTGNFLEQTDSDANLGKYVEEGLPNITGEFSAQADGYGTNGKGNGYREGAFYRNEEWPDSYVDSGKSNDRVYKNTYGFDASRSNEIYGNSEKVQPNSFKVNIWKRTA